MTHEMIGAPGAGLFTDVSDWAELGERLRTANPARYLEVKAYLVAIVEAQEIHAEGVVERAAPLRTRPVKPRARRAAVA